MRCGWYIMMMVLVSGVAQASEKPLPERSTQPAVEQQSKMQARFLPVPPRKKSIAGNKAAFYRLSPATSQKPHGILKRKEVARVSPPPAGDSHKLLLYVYDEMR